MNVALIVAAGTGSRMGKDIPKQFLLVNNKPLVIYSVEAFNQNALIDEIYIVTSENYMAEVKDWCLLYKLNKVINIIKGGDSRQESVYLGLKGIKAKDDDVILIHDGARPLVSQDIINNNIEASKKYDAINTVIKANDTIMHSKDGSIVNDVPNREELYQSQTPQTFKYGLILKGHEYALKNNVPNVTDDVKIAMLLGIDVHLVEGNKRNFKITTEEDLELFKVLIK